MWTKEGCVMSRGREYTTLYYNDYNNTFEDDDGDDSYDISIIMENDQLMYYKKMGGTIYANVDTGDFEIVFPVKDNNRTLYYDIKENVMYDEYGNTMFNIFSLIMPSSLALFKTNKYSMEVRGMYGGMVELIWPDPIVE